tara:strand:- start:7130 stop:7486 length:357 start_codon:yes stop_codon:yes gene_type:complete
MFDFFQNSLAIVLLLNIWFNTNAIVEYFVFFNIGHWIDAHRYNKYIMEKNYVSFPTYLVIKFPDSFIMRLLSCPICTCTWLNIFLFLIDLNITKFIYCYAASLFLFYLLQSLIKKSEQ